LPHALANRDQDARLALLLARAGAGLVLGWLLFSGGLMAARRLANVPRPLAPSELVAAALGLAIVSCGARTVWTRDGNQAGPGWRRVLPLAVTSSSAVLWGLSLTGGGGSPAAVAFFWLLLAGEEGAALWALAGRRRWPVGFRAGPAARQDLLLQEISRFVTAEGEEIVRGSLAVIVDRGSRVSAGHLAFCPPLARRPDFEVQPEATTNATLKISQLYPHGARIEVRLPQTAPVETVVRLQFVARTPHGPQIVEAPADRPTK
jgi:hypothetical protein